MARIIETALWVDFFRAKTPVELRERIRDHFNRSDACICEPVVFEIMRSAAPAERRAIESQFATLVTIGTPDDLWPQAARLGRNCRDAGFTVGSLDLLIATVALHHDAEIVTFDGDYSFIAQAEPKLRVQVLARET